MSKIANRIWILSKSDKWLCNWIIKHNPLIIVFNYKISKINSIKYFLKK